RLPPPTITHSRSITLPSTTSGIPSGSPKTVTPPMSCPVSALVSSADANDSRLIPISFDTLWLTSSFVVEPDDLLAAIGYGKYSARQILGKLAPASGPEANAPIDEESAIGSVVRR